MNEREEIRRYEQLLNDWKPGPGAPKKTTEKKSGGWAPSAPDTTPSPQPKATPNPSPQSTMANEPVEVPDAGTAPFVAGTILCLNDNILAIYKRPVPEKGYHLVAALLPKGAIKVEGIVLEGYQIEELGALSKVMFEKMQEEGYWTRDLIVFHCFRWEDVARIPARPVLPSAFEDTHYKSPEGSSHSTAAQPVTPTEPAKPRFIRGMMLSIKFGDKAWDAVYWGRDEQGPVVAHKTNQVWALMHLDLDRFGDSIITSEQVDSALIEQINQSLSGAQ